MTKLNERPWLNIALGGLCIAAIAVAYTTVGQASPSAAQGARTATAQRGVVQSTVSGSGNIQAAIQLNLGFKTSGTVTHIYATQGQQVSKGQLLATLDPQSAEVTLEQAKANLKSAEADLAQEQESDGASGQSSTASAGSSGAQAGAASAAGGRDVASAAASRPPADAPARSPGAAAPGTTTPAASTPAASNAPATSSTRSTTTPAAEVPPSTTPGKGETTGSSASGSAGGSNKSSGASSSSSGATVSAATREANLASSKAAVKSDELTVSSAERAVEDTKLYAPQDGTIVALSGEVGETVSATGTTRASATSSSSGGASAGASANGPSPSAATGSSSSSSASSSSSFAVLSNLSSMQLVVPLSESEIGDVKADQTATVTIEALEGLKLAAHVLSVDALSTSNSGVVSYDVTFQLDQTEARLKVGMSATAEVVIKQAEGVNVPTTAISAGAVTVLRGGRRVRRAVTTGLAGDSTTIVLSGLDAGEEVVLPSATSTTTSSSKTGLGSRLGGRVSGAGLGGGALGGGAFFRGGGPGG